MNIKIFRDSIELGNAAGTAAAQLIRDAIEVNGICHHNHGNRDEPVSNH